MLRSALELHKEVFQGLQTVDAFTQDMFLPEEVDFHLNKQMDSLVAELLDEGFADRQLRLDYIQDLVVKNRKLPVFISPTSFYYEDGAVNAYMPGDYRYLLTRRAKVRETTDCSKFIETMQESKQTFHFIPLTTEVVTAPFYSKVDLVMMPVSGGDVVIASVSMPVQEKEDTYLIVKNLLFQANKISATVNFYFEKYSNALKQGEIKLGQFIVHDDSIDTPTTVLGYKILVYPVDTEATPIVTASTFINQDIKTWDLENPPTNLGTSKWSPLNLLDNKEYYERQKNPFFTPKSSEPHLVLADDLLFAYYGKTFLIEELVIDYIREPQPISLAEGQGCELAEDAARLIANRTIEYFKLAIENPNYREVLAHNEIRDQK